MTKQDLRNKIKQMNFSSEYIQYSDEVIFSKLTALEVFKSSKMLFIYVSRNVEVDTIKIINYALSLGKRVCVPKCLSDYQMVACEINSLDDLEIALFNLLEPKNYCKEIDKKDIDLAIVPCVTCSVDNDRLGHGNGYYDRYLRDFASPKICLCRKQVVQDVLPVDKLDVKVDIVLTE